ncbi:MAG: ATP-binding protein [Rhodoferax sp.]|uniref:sensor histidine kinase n=1 Tax=Rhodoferax sp. TaxID=50421 RepID=UPI003263C161
MHSLRGRLLAAYAVGVLIVVAVLSSVFIFLFAWQDDWTARHRMLQDVASKVADRVERNADGLPSRIPQPAELQWFYDAFPRDIEFRVVDAQGRTALRVHPGEQLLPVDFQRTPKVGSVDLQVNGAAVQLATVRLEDLPASPPYYLEAVASERIIALAQLTARNPVRGSLVLALLVSIPVLIGLMLLALKSLLRPLRDTSEAAAHIDTRNLSARLPIDRVPTELVPLIQAFNQALERLEKGFQVQQQFLGAAAHELKTPLALMRGQIELEGTADRETLLMDIDVMARQVHQLLHLAEASEAANYKFETINATDVAVAVLAFLSRLADRSMVQLDLGLPEQAVHWQGDKGALFTLLKNLLENAIQHSAPGGVVTLSLDESGLNVRDEGPGIAAEHRPHLFERFWRGPHLGAAVPQGAGLGLSICQEIAVAHGWQLRLGDVPKGSLFQLETNHPFSSTNH